MKNKEPIEPSLTDAYFERATPDVRFASFLMDVIFLCLPILVEIAFIVLKGGLPEDKDYFLLNWGVAAIDLFICFLILVTLIAYYIITEALWGVTIGKLAMGCKVLLIDGRKVTFKAALLRMLVRLIPLSIFTAWGENPWHDQWTDTQVVKVRKN